jgi:hypothetical protein
LRAIAGSITAFGFDCPVIDSKGNIIARMAGNRPPKTGLETATAIVLDRLNDIEQARDSRTTQPQILSRHVC